MIDEIGCDIDNSLMIFDQVGCSLPVTEMDCPAPIDETLFNLRSSQRVFSASLFRIDLSTARRESDLKGAQNSSVSMKQLNENVASTATKIIETTSEKSKADVEKWQKRSYTHKHGGFGEYLLGIGEMLVGGTLMVTGAVIEIGSFGTLTVAVGLQEAAGFVLMTDGFARTMRNNQGIPPSEIVQKVKDGTQKEGTPRTNTAQNAQFDDAVREIERKTGRKLSDDDRRALHDQISGNNYGYHEIVEEGCWLFNE